MRGRRRRCRRVRCRGSAIRRQRRMRMRSVLAAVSRVDSFCSVTSITCGLTPQATETLVSTAAASSEESPWYSAQYRSAGWSCVVRRMSFRHAGPVQRLPLGVDEIADLFRGHRGRVVELFVGDEVPVVESTRGHWHGVVGYGSADAGVTPSAVVNAATTASARSTLTHRVLPAGFASCRPRVFVLPGARSS